MDGTVRKATAGDRPDLARLRWRWRTEEADERPAVTFDEFAASFDRWLAEREASHVGVVADVDGMAVGMGWLAIVERVPGPESWRRLSGFVQALYVEPEHRGSGLGQVLVDALVAEARSRGLQYVSVHPSARSLPLYRRAGFVDTDRVLQLRF